MSAVGDWNSLESVHWGFGIGILGDLELDWMCYLGVGFSGTLEAIVLEFQFGTNCILRKRIPI